MSSFAFLSLDLSPISLYRNTCSKLNIYTLAKMTFNRSIRAIDELKSEFKRCYSIILSGLRKNLNFITRKFRFLPQLTLIAFSKYPQKLTLSRFSFHLVYFWQFLFLVCSYILHCNFVSSNLHLELAK